MSRPRHRVAVIGLGMAVAPHAKSLVDLADRVEVVAAVSRSAARREAFARQFPFPTSGDLDAVLADRSIDAVLVLTPPNTHLDIAGAAARAGKHVLLEKPIEVSTAKSVELVEACRAAKVRLGVVLQFRFREASRTLAALIAAGALGEIVAASVAVRWWRPQSYYDEPGRGTFARDGGGVLITQAIHTLDLFLSLAGPVAEVAGFAGTTRQHRMEAEDFAGAALRFRNGALGTLDATTAAYPGFAERFEIVGTKATALFVGGTLDLHHQDGRRETLATGAAAGGGADPMAFAHDSHRAVLADFLDAIDDGRDPLVSGVEALKVHRLIDAVLASSAQGRAVAVEAGP